MHPAGGRVIGEPVAAASRASREAAHWLVRLQAGEADADGIARWRAADPAHEAAWRRAEVVMHKLGLADGPIGPLGASVLRHARGAGRRAAIRTLALLIAAGPTAFAGWRLLSGASWNADLSTATGERRELTLPDGSRIQLDTASAVDLRFSATERAVLLRRGAIWVQTAAMPDPRPFLVQAPQGTARALGTRFSMRLFDADGGHAAAAQVAVMQGAVALRSAFGPSGIVRAGHQVRMRRTEVDLPEALAPDADGWTQGVLYAEKMPLGEFAAELSRYRPGLLRCDPAVANLRISGAFQLADTDAVLRALAASLPVRIEMRTRYWVLIGPA